MAFTGIPVGLRLIFLFIQLWQNENQNVIKSTSGTVVQRESGFILYLYTFSTRQTTVSWFKHWMGLRRCGFSSQLCHRFFEVIWGKCFHLCVPQFTICKIRGKKLLTSFLVSLILYIWTFRPPERRPSLLYVCSLASILEHWFCLAASKITSEIQTIMAPALR